ncbi:MAG: quercetin dioxygenase-like cupin family protein [Halioglobus sp.]
MKIISIFSMTALLLVSFLARGEINEVLDPLVISPEQYQLKFENEHVRVVEYEILPGEKEKWHVHPAKVAYVLSGGKLKITTENGESFVADEHEGEVRWLGEVGKHFGENVGSTTIRVIFIEIKNIAQGKMDLNSYLKDATEK